ncbi:protocadherin Fat 4-like [Dendronephthya gigantea]|uniref:protocadherin Fat 4-like n=1 Tax=Dendronephthya gigantea TaxID=151771 RepID=UPI00106C8F0D|nr:protocadherin Fat 4-like [Dendronephthya gigantea]
MKIYSTPWSGKRTSGVWKRAILGYFTLYFFTAVSARIYTWRVLEESKRGTIVANLGRYTKNFTNYELAISSENFVFNKSSGNVNTKKVIDRDVLSNQCLNGTELETVQFRSTKSGEDDIIAKVLVYDINDNWPQFTSDLYTRAISEEVDPGFIVQIPTAQDKDCGVNGTVKYTILNSDCFRISSNQESLHIILEKRLNRESREMHTLNITACDQGIPSKCNSTILKITVTDFNDNKPMFHNLKSRVPIKENCSAGKFILALNVSDKDSGKNGQFTLSVSGTPEYSKLFDINSNHELVSTTCLVYDKNKPYIDIVIKAEDKGVPVQHSYASIRIDVVDVNDHTPVLSFHRIRNVSENHNVSFLGILGASDDDVGENANVSLKIIDGNPNNQFYLERINNQKLFYLKLRGTLDREKVAVYNIAIQGSDNGNPPLTSYINVVIPVHDENDNYPNCSFLKDPIFLSEALPIGSFVTIVQGEDRDKGKNSELKYSFAHHSTSSLFSIVSSSGLITTAALLDYEMHTSITLQVNVEDNGDEKLSSFCLLSINITDANDNKPLFTNTTFILSLYENAANYSVVANLTAFDADAEKNSELTFSMLSPSPIVEDTLNIDRATGAIHTLMPLDRESCDFYHFTVLVQDQGNPKLSSTAAVELRILDINDNHPVFYPKEYYVNIQRNQTDAFVVNVTAEDVDKNDNVLYEIIIKDPSKALFNISKETGSVTFAKIPRLDANDVFTLDLIARDNQGHVSNLSFIYITVITSQDDVPQFENELYNFDVKENTQAKTYIGKVKATCKTCNDILYSIHGGDQEGVFFIDKRGEIRTLGDVDYEKQSSFKLQVMARTQKRRVLIGWATVVIVVEDVNDNPPMFQNPQKVIKVKNTAPVGSVVCILTALDPDSGNGGILKYEIFHDSHQLFSILDSGDVMVAKDLSQGQNNSAMITIIVSDFGFPQLSSVLNLTIDIIKENSQPPYVHKNHGVISLLRDTRVNQQFFNVTASDPDGDGYAYGKVYFRMFDDDKVLDLFGIFPAGNLYVKKSLFLTSQSNFSVRIIATDAGEPKLNSTSQIHISVLQMQQHEKLFRTDLFRFYVFENENSGTVFGKLDFVAKFQNLNVGLVEENSYFAFDHVTNGIKTKKSIDREKFKLTTGSNDLVLYAKASRRNDFGLHTIDLSTIVVQVKDKNDNVPVFSQSNYVINIEELEKVGTVILELRTHDNDEGDNAKVNYTIVSSSLAGAVVVNGRGMVILNKQLEERTISYFNFSVQVMNIAPPYFNSSCFVEANILDVNNNEPRFAESFITKNISENSPIGREVYRAKASDDDKGRNSRLTYTITSGNQERNFEIDHESGEVKLVRKLNFERTQSFVLTISAVDSGVVPLSTTQILIVNITDVNDNAPHFMECISVLKLTEGVHVGSAIMQCTAVDSDVGDNGLVRYSISRQKPTGDFFRIDSNGTLYVSKPLDREQFPIYKIDIEAEDSALPQTSRLTSTRTITIELEDVNDNSPRFTSPPAVSIDVSRSKGDYITTLKAWDPDLGSNGTFTFSKGTDRDAKYFNVDESGRVTFAIEPSWNILYVQNVSVTDSGAERRKSEQELTVFMYKKGGLSFSQDVYNANIIENQPVGTFVIKVTAVAKPRTVDTKVRYYMTNDTSEGSLSLDTATGVISVKKRIDREGKHGHKINLIICAIDVNSNTSSSARVHLRILDLNDNIPTFSDYVYASSVSENAKIGDLLLLEADDGDDGRNGSITYEIISGDQKAVFRINESTGQISVAKNLDHEVQSSYTLNITASDNGIPSLSSWTIALISIIDVNDNVPEFQKRNYSFTVVENYPSGTIIGQTVACDPDSGGNGVVWYSLTGDDARFFTINQKSGILRTAVSFDRESIDFYLLKVVATDKGSPTAFSSVALVYISILDENDNNPKFNSSPPYIATVKENSEVGTSVVTMYANDKDVGLNSTLNYAITGGDSRKSFRISNRGTLFTTSILDRENIARYNLKITVRDSAAIPSQRRSSTTTMIVHVEDVNDRTPYFVSNSVISVNENHVLGIPFAVVSAKDEDTGLNGKVSYELQGYLAKSLFQIDQDSGKLSLRQALDRETLVNKMINITVEAKDHGEPPKHNQQYIQIIVEDVNDNTPKFESHVKFLNVYENISIGSELLRVNAVDIDQGVNGKVEFVISAGNVNDTFSIHPIDGVITVIRPLDREIIENYQIQVTAFDLGSPQRKNFTVVHIHVLDVNDNKPRFQKSPSSKPIKENLQFIENVIQFVAVDDDEGRNGEVVYSILHPERTPFLHINDTTGVISLVESLDREAQSSYSVIIEVKDNGSPAQHIQTKFSISVQDENDNSPVFINPDLKPSIPEGSPIGSQLCVMNATDADSGVNADISYALVENNGRFQIDPKTGRISTIAELDRELQGSEFELAVKAVDNGDPNRVTCVTVIGRIADINDNQAKFEPKTHSVYIPLGAPIGTFVTIVTAFDKDEGINGQVIYKLEDNSKEFLVEPHTGHVLTTRSISSFITHSLRIQAISVENDVMQDVAIVNITTKRRKNFPSFNIPVSSYTISEDAKPGYYILNVKAGEATLNIESGDPDEQFSLDIISKNLTLNKNLDYEKRNNYSLWLKASLSVHFSTYTNLQIFVLDSNDNIPVFRQPHYDAFMTETNNTNAFVICILAEDSDSGVNGQVEYKISNESALEWFYINNSTGCIYTNRRIDREQNSSFSFTVQARDHGLPTKTNNVSVHVNIRDANDNPPILNKISPVYLFEDESPNLLVTTVFAYDQDDTSTISYSLKREGNFRNTFMITPATGEVILTKKLDRETVERYPLTVSASDGKFSTSALLTIIIKDVDDNPPTFPESSYSAKFKELQPVGSVVIKLNISDKDIGRNADVVYSFKRTPTSEIFRVDSSGLITSAARFQFKKPSGGDRMSNLYNLTVYAYNPNHPFAKPTATVVVEITDANDHHPVFESDKKYAYIASVSATGTKVTTVRAVDRYDVGLNSEVSYKATGGNGTSLFSVESTTGDVNVAGNINSEIDKLFLLEIQAVDRGTPPQVSPKNIAVFITVTIKNQHPPIFTEEKYNVKLRENYEIGKEFLRVDAIDGDSGINGKVKYNILPGKQGKYFNVDSHTGSLTIANVKLDYEFLKVYVFDVQAEDYAQNPLTDQATVTITVLDYNDNPPEFQKSLYDVNIVENNQVGSEVVTISATDRDTVGNTITYTFDEENKSFKIDQNTGKITANVKFDYESRNNFTLTALAKDSGDPRKTSDTKVVVNILGMNEFTPYFKKKTYVFSVPEDADVGEIVGQVSAIDRDKGIDGLVQFILVDPSGRHNNFDIGKDTGDIYVCGRLDFETVHTVELTVLAKNPVQRILNADNTDKTNVKIEIQDRNDPPRFLKAFMKVSVYEDIAVGSVIGNFTAIDEDTKKDFVSQSLKYSILDGNMNDSFMLETFGESVSIKTSKHLDREAKESFNLTIAASDILDQTLTSLAYLFVEVKDVNDNSPFLKRGICPGHVKEGLKVGTVVLRFDATDKDVDPNKDPYTFKIVNKESVPFFIDKFTSELKTSEILNREKVHLYVLEIRIEDSGYPKKFSESSCDVIVDDVNDNRPFGDTLNVQVSVLATGFLGGIIGDVSPRDLDEINEYTCKVEGDRFKDIFEFRPKTCILDMKKPQLRNYILNVLADDSLYHVSYSLNISFNRISEVTSERSVILRLSGISAKQFLTVMNNLPCVPDAQIYSIQKVNSSITDVLMAYLQNGAYISRDKLSQILANCKNALERAIGATVVDTNYNLCSTSEPCIHGSCQSRIYLSPENRTSLRSGTEVFVSAHHEAAFHCICDRGYSGEYCQYSTKVCEGIQCKNSGQCVPTDEGFSCNCPSHFTGKYCETALDLCDPNPCSKASKCLSTREGPVCQCDFGGRGKRCELSSIGFKPLSYMTFPSLSSTDENTKTNISLQFATVERNALIFYNQVGKNDGTSRFTALEIIDETLKYSFNLGDEVVIITSDTIVSDGIWHTVSAVRNNQSGYLFIDSEVVSSNDKITKKRELHLGNSSLYIGGVPSLDILFSNDVSSYDFVGCMRDIYLNGIELNVTMTISKYGIINSCPRVPKCQEISCHGTSRCIDKWFDTLCQCTNDEFGGTKCNQKMKPLTLSGGTLLRFHFSPSFQRQTQFLQKQGKSRRRRNVKNFEVFSLNVRVRNDDAFLWRAKNNQGDFTQLHTKSGLVHLSFGNSVKKRKQVIISNVYVNNGYWFNVSVTRDPSRNSLVLSVNGSQNHTQSKEPTILLSGTWTFGSAKAPDVSVDNFQGCLSKIKINGETISLNVSNQYGVLTLEEGKLIDGCESPDYCSSSPCSDGRCVNNWHSFSCVASLDGSDRLSIGAIAGIVFFCILVIAIIVAVIAIKKKRIRKEFAARISGRTNVAIERDHSGSSSSLSLPSRKTPSRHSLSDSGVDVRNRSSSLSHENLKQTASTGTNVIALGSPEDYTIVASQNDSVSDDRDKGFTDSESEYCMTNQETNLTISSLPSRVQNRQFNRRRPPSKNASMKYDKKVPFLTNRGFLKDMYEPSRSTSPTDEPESIEMQNYSNDFENAEQYSIGASFATYSDFNDPSYNPSRYSDDPMRYKPSLERFSESDDSTVDRQLNDLPDTFQPTAHFDNSGESSDGEFTASEKDYVQQEDDEEARDNRIILEPAQIDLQSSRSESYDDDSDQYDGEMNVDDPVDFNDIFGRKPNTSREIHIKL